MRKHLVANIPSIDSDFQEMVVVQPRSRVRFCGASKVCIIVKVANRRYRPVVLQRVYSVAGNNVQGYNCH